MKNNNRLVYPKDLLNKGRSKWKMPTRVKASFMHGDAVPIQWMEVLPGDEISCPVAELIRMSTPIAPIMDDITFHFAAYFVPMRIIFENWEELCGANKDGAWTTGQQDVTVPTIGSVGGTYSLGTAANDSNFVSNHGNLSGFKYHTLHDFITGCHDHGYDISALIYRGYYEIINNNYRSQVVSAPIPVDKSSNNAIIVNEDPLYTVMRKCEPLGKYPDLFTKCLPEPERGDAVKFLAGLIPVGLVPSGGTGSALFYLGKTDGSAIGSSDIGEFTPVGGLLSGPTTPVGKLSADLSQATLSTINDLRYAFQLQKFLEADARFGTRYFEYLNAHFGITIAEGVAQLPVWLGETNFRINVDQVLSTAGYSASSSSTVGAPGANSVTGKRDNLFNFTSKEHGFIIWICGCRHNQTYSSGINKCLRHLQKLDFYHPEFANIGENSVMLDEISSETTGAESTVFGYQEAWYEYRFIPDRVVGLLNPNNTGSLDFWTLANKNLPGDVGFTLNENFIYEGRDNIARALVTGETGPDYIGDFFFDLTVTRVMPAYSIPGFADHH